MNISERKINKMQRWFRIPASLCLLILSAGILCANTASAYSLRQVQAPDLSIIDSFVTQQMQLQRIPGLALGIVHRNQIVQVRGFGTASSDGRPVTTQTPFYIGSMTKSITATAIMQLVEAGKVDLDAPVQRYLSWFHVADAQASTQITVRHLLNQTSGIPANPPQETQVWLEASSPSLEAYVRSLGTLKLTHPVGSAFEYSNTNYTILGLLVEHASGELYTSYIGHHIFAPLKMSLSFTDQSEARKQGLVQGNQLWFGIPRPTNDPFQKPFLPAGFVMSSVEDMSRFLMLHMNEGQLDGTRLLSKQSIDVLHTPPSTPSSTDYAMGWVQGKLGDESLVWHNGSISTSMSVMMFTPHSQWGVVLMTNVGGLPFLLSGVVEEMASGIMHSLVGGELLAPSYSLGTIYLIADIVSALITLAALWELATLPRWGRKFVQQLPAKRHRRLVHILLVRLLDLNLIISLVALLRNAADGFAGVRLGAINAPDLIWNSWLIIGCMFLTGIGRFWLAYRSWKRYNADQKFVAASDAEPLR